MRRRVKTRRTRAVIKHTHRGTVLDPAPALVRDETNPEPSLPSLENIIRKPLNTAQVSRTRKSYRKSKSQRSHLLAFLASRIQASNHFHGKLIRPHAVLEWLERSEPYSAEYLLENAEVVSYEDGQDASDPVFGSELDAIINRFASSDIENGPSHDTMAVPKDYSMVLTPFVASGHADHESMMIFEDEKDEFITKLTSGRRPSVARSETDDEDEEMLDALGKQIRSSQSQPSLETVFEDDEPDVEPRTPMKRGSSTAHSIGYTAKSQRGFDAVQVLKKHAIEFDNIDSSGASDLDVAIHPIFREDNFHGCPHDIYNVLKPGLQLCTLLLTHRATASFWYTLCYGVRKTTANHAVKRIDKDVPWSPDRSAQFAAKLLAFAQSVHFHFGLYPTPTHTTEYSYASMHPIKDHLVGWQPKPGEPCRRSRIRLHTDFYTTACKLSKLRNPDRAQVLRFNFFFAVNLAHEFAHFLWMSSWSTERTDVYNFNMEVLAVCAEPEPYFNDQCFNELGAAFETKVFGGRIEPISCRVDCLYGLTTSDQPNATDPHPTRTFYTIPMEFIAKMQRRQTWEKDYGWDNIDWKVFHVPRDGARSISVPYFDMTVWRDEGVEGLVSDVGTKAVTRFKRVGGGIVRTEDLDNQN